MVWVAAYVILRFVLYPPIPSALLKTYMGLISLVLFLLVSSDEESWTQFKEPILKVLGGVTPGYRGVRTVTFVALPALIAPQCGAGTPPSVGRGRGSRKSPTKIPSAIRPAAKKVSSKASIVACARSCS